MAVKVANQGDADRTIARPTEELEKKAAEAAEVGGESEGSSQEDLQAPGDGIEARREQDAHTEEVDRELGLVFRNGPDFRWCDQEGSTDRRQLQYGGRAQGNGDTRSLGTAVGIDESFPTSRHYPPKHAIWGVPAGELPLPHTQVLSEMEIEGRHVLPVLAPRDSVTFHPAPPDPEQHLVPQHKDNGSSRLLAGSHMFAGHTARKGGLGELEEMFQQRSSGRHDEASCGFAVARARQRLDSFRKARQIILTTVNSDHGHENVPSQVAQDEHTTPKPQDGAKAMLSRLKEMRCSVFS